MPTEMEPFWKPHGYYHTARDGTVRRFRCRACGRTFAQSTFLLTYYTKKNLDFAQIFRSISAAESLASIARNLRCRPDPVQNRLERLGRASLAMHARLSGDLACTEDLVADGFESFERSQYFPCHLNLLVGANSQFLYALTHVTLRRKGRMTGQQKLRRTALERRFLPPRGALVESFARLAKEMPRHWNPSRQPTLVLRTDEHPAYPRALRRIPELVQAAQAGRFRHERYSSTLPRTLSNPLFPVNYWDRELRKDLAAFRRESTCITRNVGAGLLRGACHLVWHNYRKVFRVKGEWAGRLLPVHAEVAGVNRTMIEGAWSRLFIDRPFPSRDPLPDWAQAIWDRRYPTPLAAHADYIPKFARIQPPQASGF